MAEAITIHKSQGSSYERVTIDLPNRNERSLIYIALSRATSLNGLFLLGKFKPTNPDPGQNQVPQQQQNTGQDGNLRNRRNMIQRRKIYPFEEMNRLRNEAMFIPKFTKLTDVQNDCLQIVSHNVRSLNAHAKCISSDTVVLASHIALFQETWLKTNNNHNIPNKVVVARNMLPDLMTRGKGTIIYGSDQINVESLGHFDRNNYTHANLTVCKFQNIFIVIYKSDNATINNLEHILMKIGQYMLEPNLLVCGDFNDELSAFNNSTTKLFNEKFNLKLLSPLLPTTDRGTSIDGVFGRLRDYDFDITLYESYFSDHKPLVIRIFKKQESHTGLTQDLQIINV